MPHELQRLLPRHHRIIDLTLEGLDRKAIAGQMQMTPEAIGQIQKSPIVQDEIARRRGKQEAKSDERREEESQQRLNEATRILQDASVEAAETHRELLSNEDPTVRQRSASAILDRTFGKNKDDVGQQVTIEKGAIQLLQIAAEESDQNREERELLEQPADSQEKGAQHG